MNAPAAKRERRPVSSALARFGPPRPGVAGWRGFVWLASYPKSGNTWFRMLLANLLADSDRAVPLNTLLFRAAIDNGRFGELAGVAFDDLNWEEMDRLIPAFLRLDLAKSSALRPRRLYRKVHSAYVVNRAGKALFPNDATAGAVYIVRNPLDVAASWAFHSGLSFARSTAHLNDRCATMGGPHRKMCRERLLDWSGNVRSWSQAPFPVLVLRYEDLLADTAAELRRAVRFLRLEDVSEARLRRAVAHSSFARLRRIEERKGFVEKPQTSAGRFFREGRAGGWREHLSAAQARLLVHKHWATMEAFGYDPRSTLDEIDAREGERRLAETEARKHLTMS